MGFNMYFLHMIYNHFTASVLQLSYTNHCTNCSEDLRQRHVSSVLKQLGTSTEKWASNQDHEISWEFSTEPRVILMLQVQEASQLARFEIYS